MLDDRSGVFILRKHEGDIAAILCGFFLALPRAEQLAELGDEKLLEKSSKSRVRLHKTPNGIPVMMSRHPRVFPYRKLQAFQDERQVICDPVPRDWLESLSETEYNNKPWLQLTRKEKLATLDRLAGMYRKGKP